MQSLANKHAFVTGGATGIGLATTKALAAAGARVTIASRNARQLAAAARDVENVTSVVLDVTDAPMVGSVIEAAGPIDVLVNNAGIARTAPFQKVSAEHWAEIMSVNLTGVFLVTQAALKSMRAQDSGRIVTIASTAGLKAYPYISAYAASKHGVVGLMRALALELAGTDITVNCVCPGFTDTDIAVDAIAAITEKTGRSSAEALAELVRHNPQNRLISADEVAAAVLWLCQDSSRSVTGQSIVVAGGEIM